MTVNLDEKLHNADWPKRTPDMPDWLAFLEKLTPAQKLKLPAAYLPLGHRVGLTAAYQEEQHPRDPGGEGGGRWIPKDSTGVDEGTEKQPYATDAARSGYLKTGIQFQRTAKKLIDPYKDEEGFLPHTIPVDAILKDNVAKELLKRLEGDKQFEAMVEKFKEMPAWTRWDVELSRGFAETVAYAKYLEEHGSSAGWNSSMAVKPSDNEIGVAMAVGSWAATSSDADVVSLSMQQAAIEEFGLTGISKSLQENIGMHSDPTLILGGRKFLRAQYDLTQQFFKDAGVTEVEAFRGVHFEQMVSELTVGQGPRSVTFNPISSFSVIPDTALEFANRGNVEYTDRPRTHMRAVIAQSIPVSKILSTPFTGFGCYDESEITVLGDTTEAYVNAWRPTWYDNATETEEKGLGSPPRSGDAFFLEWRDHKYVKVKK